MRTSLFFGLASLLCALALPVFAQNEFTNWYFGNRAALRVPLTGPLVQLPGSAMSTEGSASISDGSGRLQFYTNGDTIWNRNNQVMRNGTAIGGFSSSTQAALIVRQPGQLHTYYVFTVDAYEYLLARGLRYSVVDMRQENGTGSVGVKNQVLSGRKVTEKLTAVPHSNGVDTWILVHGWDDNVFYAYLLTRTGITPTPVVSATGAVHTFAAAFPVAAVGYMRASPNGRRLALAIQAIGVEVADFDPSTGLVSNAVHLQNATAGGSYGVEFSPDNHLLYCAQNAPTGIVQYDVDAGTPSQVMASAIQIATTTGKTFLLGPDDRIYFTSGFALARINAPNNRGAACQIQLGTLPLGPATGLGGLPNNYHLSPPLQVQLNAGTGCTNRDIQFTATTALAGANIGQTRWHFPGGSTAVGSSVVQRFSAAGTYSVTAELVLGPDTVRAATSVTVVAPPDFTLTGDSVLCLGQNTVLAPQGLGNAAVTYRWQDGSVLPTLRVTQSGEYALEVTAVGSCTVRRSLHVRFTACTNAGLASQLPNIITPNADTQNDAFVLRGLQAADWQCQVFNRWGVQVYMASSYANDWDARDQPAGVYYYLLRHTRTNQQLKGWVEVVR